jgi:ClpP class serine protease
MPKPANRIIQALTSHPWAITQEYLKLMLEIAARQADLEAVETQRGEPLQNTYGVEMRGDTAVIPISGPIFRYANLFTAISGGTSIQLLARDFASAVKNPDVKAILLNIDSPGGEVNGTNELANMIFAARGQKPVWAYVGGTGASAAYWIASAAERVIADDTAMVGSIGVIAAMPIDDEEGEVTFVSSQSPNKRPDPTTEGGAATIQATIDALAQVFVDTVARNRGVAADTVLTSFGQGGVFVGSAAVQAGLVDSLGSFEGTLAEIAGKGNTQVGAGRSRTPTVSTPPLIQAPALTKAAGGLSVRDTQPNNTKENIRMDEETTQQVEAPPLPPLQPPQLATNDPAVQAQVNAVVAQMTAQFEAQRQIVLEQAQAQFQRQLAEMQARQQIETYAQHVTTPTLQRQHALPLEASAVATFLSGLSADQRTSARGLFDRILDAGLVSFEELGTSAESVEQSAGERFEGAVNAKVSAGMSRLSAIQAVGKEQPALYAEYQAESSRRGMIAKKGGK